MDDVVELDQLLDEALVRRDRALLSNRLDRLLDGEPLLEDEVGDHNRG